ncbi:MAG: hypothetical protein MZV70_39065 [Desulfobacterales bacterium]|nr:hypothetical protein [Desulfobacterales bacterium]
MELYVIGEIRAQAVENRHPDETLALILDGHVLLLIRAPAEPLVDEGEIQDLRLNPCP